MHAHTLPHTSTSIHTHTYGPLITLYLWPCSSQTTHFSMLVQSVWELPSVSEKTPMTKATHAG